MEMKKTSGDVIKKLLNYGICLLYTSVYEKDKVTLRTVINTTIEDMTDNNLNTNALKEKQEVEIIINNKYDENKATKKTTRKSGRFNEEFDAEKLKNLKQVDKLSHMFNEQDGEMLDYYDLTTERGKRNRKRIQMCIRDSVIIP